MRVILIALLIIMGSDDDIFDQLKQADYASSDVNVTNLFDPIYENVTITLCGVLCAIMEFKRACRLPFTTIGKLLELLQLICSPNNTLPQTLYDLKKFL